MKELDIQKQERLPDDYVDPAYDINRATDRDQKWKTEYFEKFIKSMVDDGWTDDRGSSAGQYGIVSFIKGEMAGAAWCDPPANENDPDGLSKIVVRGLVPGGTKQDSFYFNDSASFKKALTESRQYSGLRLKIAADTIESASGRRISQQDDGQ